MNMDTDRDTAYSTVRKVDKWRENKDTVKTN